MNIRWLIFLQLRKIRVGLESSNPLLIFFHKSLSGLAGEHRACRDKINYKSQKTALRAKQEMEAKRDKIFDAYNCWWCNGWHIGKAWNQKYN